jgi:hypothetical protein
MAAHYERGTDGTLRLVSGATGAKGLRRRRAPVRGRMCGYVLQLPAAGDGPGRARGLPAAAGQISGFSLVEGVYKEGPCLV